MIEAILDLLTEYAYHLLALVLLGFFIAAYVRRRRNDSKPYWKRTKVPPWRSMRDKQTDSSFATSVATLIEDKKDEPQKKKWWQE